MTLKELTIALNGKTCFTVKSPYHKNKRLPFRIIGFTEYPIIFVLTQEYKGKVKNDVTSIYNLDTILEWIESGFLKSA